MEIHQSGSELARFNLPQKGLYSHLMTFFLFFLLQDNRLEDLPPALFTLPALVILDVSNNKLRALPDIMWNAPCLRDLNAALNHLKDLPGGLVSIILSLTEDGANMTLPEEPDSCGR